MLKQKITGIIMGTLMISGVVIGTSSINNTKITNDNTKVVNKVLLASPSSLVGERAVVVNTDNSPLVLYSSASGNSNITSYISVGEMLTIQSSGDNFYKVKVQETGAVGYISAHNLQIITSGINDPYSIVNKQGYIINVSSRVNLRANATMDSNILNKLTNNTKINILGKQGQWYKISCDGTVRYIYQEYIGINLNESNNTNTSGDTNKINKSNNDVIGNSSSKVSSVSGGSINKAQNSNSSKVTTNPSKVNSSDKVKSNNSAKNSQIVVKNAKEAIALVRKKIGTSINSKKITWSVMCNVHNPLLIGNDGIKFYWVRGQYSSKQGIVDLDYYVLQNGDVMSRYSKEGQKIFV
ncbi:SH3 domain-containing protein [Clostridium mediterraneense]|uniref:SH3 domain-containing protein n=1 Tax=Clostridium mediterraneense TaxID=1805472 RepID=UPI000834EF3A|nr:SH3 domain-containing protein [Clostridium mediterraneense]